MGQTTSTALTSGLGFIASTALLYGIGVGLGVLLGRRSPTVTRVLGVATRVGGAWLAAG